jgi:uncharacterized membrane protein YqjE
MQKQLTCWEISKAMERHSFQYLIAFVILFTGGGLIGLCSAFVALAEWKVATWTMLATALVCVVASVICYWRSLHLTSKS